MATDANGAPAAVAAAAAHPNAVEPGPGKAVLRGRAFYESIGSPKYVVAPMVAQSEFAWRMLTRSFLPPSEQSSILAYTPMFHARLFKETESYREQNFQPVRPGVSAASEATTPTPTPWLDGNPTIDRPLFVQFCANDPEALLGAAQRAAPYCDAVDINFGCPQGIARKGHYGAFLQEDQDLVFRLVNTLHRHLSIPVTAKIRILDTREATLAYALNVLRAGASILTVHGRRREQKGHLTGLADWSTIRWLRDQLPPETVLFANGNILEHGDLARCLEATGADAVMSAEGNLSDPGLFAAPPADADAGRAYWRGRDGKGGWRVDEVMRRYLDILHTYVAGAAPPRRRPLFLPGDDAAWLDQPEDDDAEQPARKKVKRDGGGKKKDKVTSPNYGGMQPHMFHLLRHFVSRHTDVRDMLAKARSGDLEAYEAILAAVERKVAEGLLEYERTDGKMFDEENGVTAAAAAAAAAAAMTTTTTTTTTAAESAQDETLDGESSVATVKRCKRPWWVVQPIVRPLPKEALAKGAIRPSKKDLQKLAEEEEAASKSRTLTPEGQPVEGKGLEGKGLEGKGLEDKRMEDKRLEDKVLATDDKLLAG
ncbi:hypothetical protein VD0002_g3203 [Verticillium dahliae]|nr:hypothetical protein BJF96_g9175 [Verticillium dahliae]PNH56717.1 hypothetical protein VD0003_g1034 [Verticillium dahliae]PNH65999.1 hypothetical protein VD0002_g3203 [Verticillium dahliae]